MLRVSELTVDGRFSPVGISSAVPDFSWKLESNLADTMQVSYQIKIWDGPNVIWNGGLVKSGESAHIPCGAKLSPHRELRCHVEVTDNHDQFATVESVFFTGKLSEPWMGAWIGSMRMNDKRNELPPELFQKTVHIASQPVRAILYVSAMGIYEAELNGQKVGNIYFAPGYTHYQTYFQFQTYDVTGLLQLGANDLRIVLANGWYLGTIGKKNNTYGSQRGLIAELHLWGKDGSHTVTGTDETWQHTVDTPFRYADFYNGQIIDAAKADETVWKWESARALESVKQKLRPHYGAYVTEDTRLIPVSHHTVGHRTVYDFGQNHAGVLHLKVDAAKDTVITIRHGEIINEDGSLFTANLRKARQTLTLICGRDGVQDFMPRLTFMGFRYAEVTADRPFQIISLESAVLTSDARPTGEFSCSDPLLTRYQQNIQWGQRSNFIDIPTDCPQRDERMGWTGDIAVFAQTAAFNRNISAFMRKWLTDLRMDQRENGTLPVTVPEIKTYQPTPFHVPIAIWGDAATMVPWAVYRAYGDKRFLGRQYESMKKYVQSEIRAAARSGHGKGKYLWDRNPFQYGDWCAPGENVFQWERKGKYLSTAFLANSVDIMRRAAEELGKTEDSEYFAGVHNKVLDAFSDLCILPDGRLIGDFQSSYVCALYFGLVPETKKAAVAKRLADLVRAGKHRIQTGFAGTPYIAFALADNGYVEDAYKLLQNTQCPSWLYTVKAGGTTVWERWDALDENGHIRQMGKKSIADMVSFNHYAYGAVGDFYYRRILGIEPVLAGYREFRIQPVPGGTLTYAEGSLETVYGKIAVRWERKDGTFSMAVTIPCNTVCTIILPDGNSYRKGCGKYSYQCQENPHV